MQVVDTIFWCLLVMLCLPCLCLRRLTLTLFFSCRILSHVRIPPSLPRLSWEAAKLSLHEQIARYFTAACCMCGTFKHLSKVGDLGSVDIKQESTYSTYIQYSQLATYSNTSASWNGEQEGERGLRLIIVRCSKSQERGMRGTNNLLHTSQHFLAQMIILYPPCGSPP